MSSVTDNNGRAQITLGKYQGQSVVSVKTEELPTAVLAIL